MFADEKLQSIEAGITTVPSTLITVKDSGTDTDIASGTMAKAFSTTQVAATAIELTTTKAHKKGHDYIFVSVVSSNCIVAQSPTIS